MIRVCIVDDHQVVRDGIESVLERAEDLEVAGSYATGQALMDDLAGLSPDVVVMDMGLPDGTGAAWAEAAKRDLPAVRVVILTGLHSHDKLVLALDAGVDGFLYKESSGQDLLSAIREVAKGGFYASPEAARKMRDMTTGSAASSLTPREVEVLVALRDGLTTDEMARQLLLSASTVKTHLASIYRKLSARNRVEAIREAAKQGVIGES